MSIFCGKRRNIMFNYKANYEKDKAIRDKLTYDHSLWKRFEDKELNDAQIDFLQNCMIENLNHARHAENERLTFNSIFLALVAGALAFASSFPSEISFFIYLAITMTGFMSMLLTSRWNNTFARHLFFAQQCYKLIHKSLFGDAPGDECSKNDKWESIDGLDDIPMYSFKIYSPIAYTSLGKKLFKIRTKVLYNTFYWTIQILLISCTIMTLIDIL